MVASYGYLTKPAFYVSRREGKDWKGSRKWLMGKEKKESGVVIVPLCAGLRPLLISNR